MTLVGATICEDHAKKVLSYVESAKSEGAKVEYGGERVILEGKLRYQNYQTYHIE